MALKNLTDEEIKKLLENPEGFLKKKENMDSLLGFDSGTKRKFADILKYDLNLTDEQIKAKLDEVAMIRLKEIDVFS